MATGYEDLIPAKSARSSGYDDLIPKQPASTNIPGPRQRGFFETIGAPIQAASEGIISGGGNVMFGGQRLLGMGLEKVGATSAGQFLQEDAARRLAESFIRFIT